VSVQNLSSSPQIIFPLEIPFPLLWNRKMNTGSGGGFRGACDPPGHRPAAAGCSPGSHRMLEDKKLLLILAPACCSPWCAWTKPQTSPEPRSAPAQLELPAARDQPLSPRDGPHPAILGVTIQSICNPTTPNFYETRFLSDSLHAAGANGHF